MEGAGAEVLDDGVEAGGGGAGSVCSDLLEEGVGEELVFGREEVEELEWDLVLQRLVWPLFLFAKLS